MNSIIPTSVGISSMTSHAPAKNLTDVDDDRDDAGEHARRPR